MNDITISFASLVKSNKGYFKSEKQAEFLNSQLDNGVHISYGTVWGANYQLAYACDAKGVVTVTKSTAANGAKVIWQRVVDGCISVQDAKETKRIARMIAQIEKIIVSRDAAVASGEYTNMKMYADSNQRDIDQLIALHAM
jgi:hypothetical protein